MSVVFLSAEQVMRIHRSMIEHYGGIDGLRDLKLLESAVAMPQAAFEGSPLHADVFEMAAAYLFHLVCNHPFVDGNKRTGAGAAVVFLAMNNIELEADEDGLARITLRTAQGLAGKKDIGTFLKSIARDR